MLYLLDGQTKTAKWNGQPLFETVSATVEEELNGIFQLRLTYPITDSGVHETLRADELILCPTPDLGNQLFRVKQAKIQDDRVELECSHISDDVMKRQIKPFSATNTTCQSALMRMVEVCPSDLGLFSFDSDVTERHTYVSDEDLTLYQALMDGKHSILGTWEGELVRDNFQLIVKKHRGNDKGVILTSHHNLKAFEDKGDSEKVITRIYATSTFQIEGSDEDTVLSVVVESPLINQYPYVHEARYENNTLQTEEELRQWAMAKFTHEHIDSISRQITVEAYQLDGQEVHLGDTVTLKSQKHKVDVKKKAVSYTFDALEEVYLLVTFDDEVSFTTSGSSGNNSLTSAAKTILDVNQSATEHRASKERANFKKVFDRHFERLQTEVEDGIAKAKAEGERSGKKAALDYLATDALEARVAALQKATIDELTVSSSAWMTRLVSQQILSEYVKSLEIEADKVVIPGQHTPVFSLDRDGSLSIDTPLLKVRGDSLATKVDLKTISLTPGPKGDAGADGVGIQLREQYYLVSAQKTGISTTSSGWSKTIPSLTSTLKYLWNYEKTTFTNGSTTVTTPIVIGVYGDKGVDGKAGKDGKTLYTWRMYADSDKGDGISAVSTGKRYLGLAVNRESATPSTNPSDYTWSSFFEGTELGGRNYIDDYAMKAVTFSSVTSEWKKEVVEDTSSVSGVTVKMTCTKAGTAGFHRNFYDLRSRIGATMTFSIDIKCSKSVTLNMGCELGGTKAYEVTTDWQRFVSSWKVSSYQYYSYIFYLKSGSWSVGDVVYLRNVQLEDGNVASAPGPSLNDLIAQIDTKADNGFMKQQLDLLTEKTESLRVDLEARALAKEVADWLKSYKEFEKNNEAVLAQFNQDFIDNTARIAAIEADLKANSLLLNFVNTYLRAGDNGVIIGKKDNSEYIELTSQGMMIKSAGNAVMTVTAGVIKIHHGVFVETLQVGYYRLEAARHNAKHLVCRFIDAK